MIVFNLLSYREGETLTNLSLSGYITDISDWLMIKVIESKISNLKGLISFKIHYIIKPQLALF